MGIATRFVTITAALVVVGAGTWYGGRIAVEHVVHDYILDHPEILPQAMDVLQKRQAEQSLAGVRASVETPFPGAVLGNPNGKITLVEFSDFACGYCRKSLPDIAQLLASNPDLRIVMRELPVISQYSPDAAKVGLAAAEQGKYAQFHDAMFAAGQVDPQTIEAVAHRVGLDMARAQRVAGSKEVAQEIDRNMEVANRLGFSGTPSWVIGDHLITGAVGIDKLSDAVKDARAS